MSIEFEEKFLVLTMRSSNTKDYFSYCFLISYSFYFLFTAECVEGERDVIEEGEKVGDEYEQPLGYVVVPMGNLTDLVLPTDDVIPIPR